MKISTREEWKASRKISNRLAEKLRADTATEAEEREYRLRDAAEEAFSRKQPTSNPFAGKTCFELGLMP